MKKKMYLLVCCLAFSLVGCGGKNTDANDTGPDHVHKFEMQYQSTATCKEEGKRVEKCKCGHTQTVILEKAPHNYKERVKERPTCDKPGIKVQKCSACSHEIEEENVSFSLLFGL